MASLRTRLLVAVLAITAAGLLLLAGITYFGQRSFLLDRLDDQIAHAPPAAADALGKRRRRAAARAAGRAGGPAAAGRAAGCRREPTSSTATPTGTSTTRRSSTTSQDITADPALPADMPVGEAFTVDGENGDDNSYRVYAEPDRFGSGVTVVAAPLTEIEATLHRLLLLESLVIGGVLLVLGFVAWAVVRVGLLPFDRIGHTAGAIAGGDLSHRVESVDPRTEVGRLGIAFNAMLDRLEGAFTQRQASEDRLRRFLADASHELRTPLASIRGYAELFRMGAARSPEDVEKAMRRIEDEAARMGVLVEDLLTLARLDEIAEAPHTSVDVAALAGDAVDDARAVAPERAIALSSSVDGGAVVLGDAHQLRQVFANLLRNALVHTPAGTPIEVGVGSADGVGARGRARPRARPARRRSGGAVRALLAGRGRPGARQGRRRAGARDRGGDRGCARGDGVGRGCAGWGCRVLGAAAGAGVRVR